MLFRPSCDCQHIARIMGFQLFKDVRGGLSVQKDQGSNDESTPVYVCLCKRGAFPLTPSFARTRQKYKTFRHGKEKTPEVCIVERHRGHCPDKQRPLKAKNPVGTGMTFVRKSTHIHRNVYQIAICYKEKPVTPFGSHGPNTNTGRR